MKGGNMTVNPNQALWEKGDFTRIADTMRESGKTSARPRYWSAAQSRSILAGWKRW
jgi:hypothetical protein